MAGLSKVYRAGVPEVVPKGWEIVYRDAVDPTTGKRMWGYMPVGIRNIHKIVWSRPTGSSKACRNSYNTSNNCCSPCLIESVLKAASLSEVNSLMLQEVQQCERHHLPSDIQLLKEKIDTLEGEWLMLMWKTSVTEDSLADATNLESIHAMLPKLKVEQPRLGSGYCPLVGNFNKEKVNIVSSSLNDEVLTCSVNVSNTCYSKVVTARVTYDKWISHTDVSATWTKTSTDGTTDTFTFSVPLKAGHQLGLAVKYQAGDAPTSFWDGNYKFASRITGQKHPGFELPAW